MSRWVCRYIGTNETWESSNDQSLWASNITCTKYEDQDPTPRMTYVDPTNANYGLSPSGPDAPAKDPVTGIFTTVYQDTLSAAKPKAKSAKSAKSASGGCCQEANAECLLCWVKEHWQWLLVAALALAAYLTRKR